MWERLVWKQLFGARMGDGEAEWFKDLMVLQGEGKKENEGDTESEATGERPSGRG